MHDIVDLESRGVRGVFVASEQFVDGAAAQAAALGAENVAVFVEHPIQDRTDEEMVVIADGVVERLIESLLGG